MTSSQAELQVATVRPAEHMSPVESAASSPAAPFPLPVQRRGPEPVTGSSPRGPLDNLARPVTIRRSIDSFKVDKREKFDPPSADLIGTLKAEARGLFQQSDGDVSKAVKGRLANRLVRTIPTPRELTVDINDELPTKHPARGGRQTNIGQIGADEFFIRTGKQEAFEGGHLVGHQFWDEGDADAESAGEYENLVPMSRTMNVNAVEGWKKTEDRLRDKILDLNKRQNGETARLKIKVERDSNAYQVSLGEICQRFGLNLKDPANGTNRIKLYQWLPESIKSSWENLDTGSDSEFSPVKESSLRNLKRDITSKKKLGLALQQSPLWARMTDEAREEALKVLV